MKTLALLFMGLIAVLGGCKSFEDVSDEDLASTVYSGSKAASSLGLRLALEEYPDKVEEIKTNAALATTIIRGNILPIFSDANTGDILRSAVDAAIVQLADRVTPTVASAIRLAMDFAVVYVKLPANPADKLDVRTKMSVYAFFSGVVDGFDVVLNPPAVVNPPPVDEGNDTPSEPQGANHLKDGVVVAGTVVILRNNENKLDAIYNRKLLTWCNCICGNCGH